MEVNEIFGWVGSLLDMLGLRPFIIAFAIVSVAIGVMSMLFRRD